MIDSVIPSGMSMPQSLRENGKQVAGMLIDSVWRMWLNFLILRSKDG